MAEFRGTSFSSALGQGAVRWSAPEIYHMGSTAKPSKYSDAYSLGSVMLQVSYKTFPSNDFFPNVA